MYRPKHFILQELVGPAFFKRWGERAWWWLQAPMLITLDQLREDMGPITVNNWHQGGPYSESGLRDFATSTGAVYSQHKYGGADDLKFARVTPAEAAQRIQARPERFPHLTTLEDPAITIHWLHADCRNHGGPGILIVAP